MRQRSQETGSDPDADKGQDSFPSQLFINAADTKGLRDLEAG